MERLEMPIFEGIALFGLTPEFQRAMRLASAVFAAIYLVYPLALGLAWFAWRKGRVQIARVLIAATLILGIGVPWIDQLSHNADKISLLRAEIRAESLDIAGQHIVVIGRACTDFCKWMLRYGKVERVTLVTASRDLYQVFGATGVFPPESEAFDVVLDGLTTIETPVELETVRDAKKIAIRYDPWGFADALPSHVPKDVAPENIRISTYFAAVNWGRPLDEWTPKILTLIHKDQAFLMPLHPFARTNRPTADFEAESRYLGDLLCPWPHARLGRVCSQTAKP